MKLIDIYSAAGQLEADMLKGFLEAQGLQVYLSQESVGRTLGLSAGSLGIVSVMVPESQVNEARTLLADIAAGEFDNTENSEEFEEISPDEIEP